MRKSLLTTAILSALTLPAVTYADEATPAAPATPSLLGPGMNYPLTANATPLSVDAGPIGKVYVSGAVSGIALFQNNAVSNPLTRNTNSMGDISNGQIMLQKVDGPIQFFIEAGGYSTPIIGQSYIRAAKDTGNTFGVVPAAFIKIAPNDSFSIQAGKLPTLIGVEYAYTFENTNIQRGLLWNQEPVFSRGVQANFTKGPIAASVSATDGFYSNDYKWLTGSIAYTINDSNAVTLVAGGNLGTTTAFNSYTIPLAQNNSQIYNLIYKYTNGPLTLQPYLQYTYVPTDSTLGFTKSTSSYGAALLANYAVNSTVNIGARAEYIGSSGSTTDGAQNLLGYGAGSNAWEFTITPTYQKSAFFVRGELSYMRLGSMSAGSGFGSSGNDKSQTRLMAETGFMF